MDGFLASVKTHDKLQLLQRFTPPNWIGLNDIDIEGTFVWDGNGEVAFSVPHGKDQWVYANAFMGGLWMNGEPCDLKE